MTTENQIKELKKLASECESKAQESFERCDTDGYLSQWAHQVNAGKYRAEADLLKAENMAEFRFLQEGDRVLNARTIQTRYGESWILDDPADIQKFGKFVPSGPKSRKQKQLGLHESWVLLPAKVILSGDNRINVSAQIVQAEWKRIGSYFGRTRS